MKKQLITIAIVLGIGGMSFAQEAGSFEEYYEDAGFFKNGLFHNATDDELITPYGVEVWELYTVDYDKSDENLGLFGLNKKVFGKRDSETPGLPEPGNGGDSPAPLGSGIAVLTALGAAYLVGKKRKEE